MEPSIIWEDWPRIAWADLLMVLFPTLAIIAITTATRRKAYIVSIALDSWDHQHIYLLKNRSLHQSVLLKNWVQRVLQVTCRQSMRPS